MVKEEGSVGVGMAVAGWAEARAAGQAAVGWVGAREVDLVAGTAVVG